MLYLNNKFYNNLNIENKFFLKNLKTYFYSNLKLKFIFQKKYLKYKRKEYKSGLVVDYLFIIHGIKLNKQIFDTIYDLILKYEVSIKMVFISGYLDGSFYNLAKGLKLTNKEDFVNHYQKGLSNLENKDYNIQYFDLLLVRILKNKKSSKSLKKVRHYSTLKSLKIKKQDNSIYGIFILNFSNKLKINSINYKIFYNNKIWTKNYILKNRKSYENLKKDLKDILNVCKNKSIYIYFPSFTILESSFIYNIFLKEKKDLTFLMDNSNKMIEITYKKKIFFRDLNRIFPSFNLKENKLDTFYIEFEKKRNLLWNLYKIKLSDIYSNSNLAFNIYRTYYLKKDLPIISKYLYYKIKPSYFGGSTEIYKPYGKNLYHYDVNSLYPYVMLKDMPGKYEKYEEKIENLENFFGFINCEIEIPQNINIPMVPVRINNKIIYPVGKLKGLYFSEEIKSWLKLGYKVKLNSGYSFEKIPSPFKDFINDFYKIKKENTNLKFLAKSFLNGLYGYFARNPIISQIEIISDLDKKWEFINECDWIENLNKNDWLIKKSSEFNYNQIYNEFSSNYKYQFNKVKSNIAIASAITSYARIYMQNFKLLPNTVLYYTDTDSIIINKPLNLQYLSKEIGLMKLENEIKEIYILAPKVYAYINKENKEIIKASGFPSKDIKFKDFKDIYNNKKTNKKINYNQLQGNFFNFNLKNYTLYLKNLKKNNYSRQFIYYNNTFIDSKPLQLR
jgi:hypothetical protein